MLKTLMRPLKELRVGYLEIVNQYIRSIFLFISFNYFMTRKTDVSIFLPNLNVGGAELSMLQQRLEQAKEAAEEIGAAILREVSTWSFWS